VTARVRLAARRILRRGTATSAGGSAAASSDRVLVRVGDGHELRGDADEARPRAGVAERSIDETRRWGPEAHCAGLQLDFPAQQLQGVAEVWVPFDEVIAVGWA
jgi:hypothetical protein